MWFSRNRHHTLFHCSLPHGLVPIHLKVSYEEYVDKVLFFEQRGTLLGVLFIDEEMKELYLAFGSCELER